MIQPDKIGFDTPNIDLRPSPYHVWDIHTNTFSLIPEAKKKAKEDLLLRIQKELKTRLYSPCDGFDATPVSRERITNVILRIQRGDGLPSGWKGWRDSSNQMRWADCDAETVLLRLTDLMRNIEDREQRLLLASWKHKEKIKDLKEMDKVLSYEVRSYW